MLGDLEGLDVAHLQCHIGLDSLALADAGARVTGLDFSPAAIEAARDLARRAGLSERARFVEGDVLSAKEILDEESFDLVYVSLGALCWLPSIKKWAAAASFLLRPGGRLYLHDVHPLAGALADDELRIARPYFEEPEPWRDVSGVTYTDGELALTHADSYEWNHSLGEIFSALTSEGLSVLLLVEHDWTVWPMFPWLIEAEEHRWCQPPGGPRLPLTFTLLASAASPS